MNKIQSFLVDHTKIQKGMYISRVDGKIVTYDIRFIKPNTPPYLESPAIHTIEHLFATYARNSDISYNILYIGPMGCRTGFYLLTRDLPHSEAIQITLESMKYISKFNGEIPGAREIECGNYLEHDLEKARVYAQDMVKVLNFWSVDMLSYNKE